MAAERFGRSNKYLTEIGDEMESYPQLKNRLYRCGVLPVANLHQDWDIQQVAAELCAGGVSAIVLVDSPLVREQISAIRAQHPECLVIVQCENHEISRMSPVADCYLLACDADKQIDSPAMIPICKSMEDVDAWAARGKDIVYLDDKVSIAQLRMVATRVPTLNFLLNDSGEDGVTLLKEVNVLAVVSGVILSGADNISQRANEEMCRIYEICSGHLGINAANYDEASSLSRQLSLLFGKTARETHRSFLIGNLVEVMHFPYRGKNGHFGILTNNLKRAMQYFQTKGVQLNMETYEENAIVYLSGEYGGFEFHLTQKSQ